MLAVLRQVILFIIERFLSSEVINVLAVLRQVILFIIERFPLFRVSFNGGSTVLSDQWDCSIVRSKVA